MFPNSFLTPLKLSSRPGDAVGCSSTETVNAPRHRTGHLRLVETGDKVEPSNGKSQSQKLRQTAAGEQEGKAAGTESSMLKPHPPLSHIEGRTA